MPSWRILPWRHDRDAVAKRHRFLVVLCYVDDGRALVVEQARQFQAHLEAQFGIDVAQRVVEQEHRRRTGKRPRERRTLLLAVGKRPRLVRKHMADLQQLGDALDAGLYRAWRRLLRRQRRRDVVEGAHVREEGEILEGHANAAKFGIDVGNVLAADQDLSFFRVDHAGDQPEQHRLSRA